MFLPSDRMQSGYFFTEGHQLLGHERQRNTLCGWMEGTREEAEAAAAPLILMNNEIGNGKGKGAAPAEATEAKGGVGGPI